MSQPTVSHALRRLRALHGDPLFVRTQGGMAPTAKAQRLAKAVEQALTTLDVAIRETETLRPGALRRARSACTSPTSARRSSCRR